MENENKHIHPHLILVMKINYFREKTRFSLTLTGEIFSTYLKIAHKKCNTIYFKSTVLHRRKIIRK